jgi:hypothetical protein
VLAEEQLLDSGVRCVINENTAMTDNSQEFRHLILRAKTLGRALLDVYESEADSAPAELLELLDLAEQRLKSAGYNVPGTKAEPGVITLDEGQPDRVVQRGTGKGS